jgi:hypothetical protein
LTFLFDKPAGRNPDLVRGRNGTPGFVEHCGRLLRRLDSRKGEPELHRERDDLDGMSEEDASVDRVVFEVDDFPPELDRIRYVLESCDKR